MPKNKPDRTEIQFAESIREWFIQQLTTANEQLEQFAYVAAHDLREPLRTIISFTDLLEKEYGSKLDSEGRNYLDINRQAAKKMEAMIADLLEYARVGNEDEAPAETNGDEALQASLEILAESIRATRAVIHSTPLPNVPVNAVRLARLFQNLIGNALKYQPQGSQPAVRVTAKDEGEYWKFSLADNGIGIEPPYLDIIFDPFKRLHSDRAYPGTGIGLAICKRIVENFKGHIWAESKFGTGSIFYFTVPKRASTTILPKSS